jgi:predicted membrane channel-forming protein YqfA (hemolysin III family)
MLNQLNARIDRTQHYNVINRDQNMRLSKFRRENLECWEAFTFILGVFLILPLATFFSVMIIQSIMMNRLNVYEIITVYIYLISMFGLVIFILSESFKANKELKSEQYNDI